MKHCIDGGTALYPCSGKEIPMNIDEIYGALHNLGLARNSLEKALATLVYCPGWGSEKLLEIVQDYVMQADANFLYRVGLALQRYIEEENTAIKVVSTDDKVKDKSVWVRLGQELTALDELLAEIKCDPGYQSVMDRKTWDRLDKLTYHLNVVRGDAESRMAKNVPDWSERTFYPVDREGIKVAVESFRQKMKEVEL